MAVKKTLVYLLIFFVSFAYNHETVEFFAKALGNTLTSWVSGPEEEEKPEAKDSKKNTKSKFSGDLFLSCALIPVYLQPGKAEYRKHLDFSPSDYTRVIYSPPDPA